MAAMISREEMEQLAALARLRLADEEIEALQDEMAAILTYVSELNELATSDASSAVGDVYNVVRDDVVTHASGAFTEALLANAPQREGKYIKVKNILKHE